VLGALAAPHAGDEEPHYPGACRPREGTISKAADPAGVNWRFRVPQGEKLTFCDAHLGLQKATTGEDLGDFIVWRKDDIPAYQLAVVVDDAAMRITEVVRGEDLLASTFRQLLIYRALGCEPPAFFHCPLVTDENGRRLAKRHDSLSLRTLREHGANPPELHKLSIANAQRFAENKRS
jgi:glutamyl-tRNA synthetase